MKALILTASLLAAGIAIPAQAPDSASRTLPSDLGFSYSIPSDWDVMNSQPTLPSLKERATQNAADEAEKQAVACVQLLLTARHGTPASVIVEVALPFDCFQEGMTEKDLPGFAAGASEGLTQSFNLGQPMYGSYALGSHTFWIERAKGTSRAQPYLPPYTVEIACSLLKKASVCWMTMAADDAELAAFERGVVSLDGEAPTALVPATAFSKKPS